MQGKLKGLLRRAHGAGNPDVKVARVVRLIMRRGELGRERNL